MGLADVGGVLFFLMMLVASTIAGLYLLFYAARCILLVVEGTANGADEVEWPDEAIVDWVGRSLGLIYITALVLAPVGILAAALGSVWLPNDVALRTLLLAAPGLWLLFPVGVLSSLSAGNRWNVFRPVIIARMLKLFPQTMRFYLLSAVVILAAVAPWYWSVFGHRIVLLLVAAPLSGAMVLIYARLLGQLASRIMKLGPLRETAPAKRREEPLRGRFAPLPAKMEINLPQPIPEAEFDDVSRIPQSPTGLLELENLVPYELADDVKPIPPREEEKPKRRRPLEPEEIDAMQGYALAEKPAPNLPISTEVFFPSLPRSWEAQQSKPHKASSRSPVMQVVLFPFYETSMSAWVWLTCGNGLLGFLISQMISSVPH